MPRWIGCVSLTFLPVAAIAQPWSDNFDSYAVGPIDGQGGWEGWGNDAELGGAEVTDAQASSAPHSLGLRPTTDLVRSIEGVGSGLWAVRGEIFIPSDHSGVTFLILLNRYSHGGPANWSTQLKFDSSQLISQGGSGFRRGVSTDSITDRWVSFEILIDLDANQQTIFYNGEVFDQTPWQRTGDDSLAAINLYSDNGSDAYFDNLELVRVGSPQVPALSLGGFVLLVSSLLTVGFFVFPSVRHTALAAG